MREILTEKKQTLMDVCLRYMGSASAYAEVALLNDFTDLRKEVTYRYIILGLTNPVVRKVSATVKLPNLPFNSEVSRILQNRQLIGKEESIQPLYGIGDMKITNDEFDPEEEDFIVY